ncbi:alanyl-tRNA editing protein (plasmid) [Photobacterium sp. GJ3]|uniref:alanyl-tRNA editing protein n=1 Tax=Photobacterium sp. GJ3 TaxID=2829502 RepID=UPI001B8B2560|nr:alanyl-tRNA editing protein [Photobacterium sp. GJ3]QUJ69834.1 alanyl-tRNA editing protein [Photobacterium sp. GJ3]
MTKRLYMETSELSGSAQVLRCEADESGYFAELDATLFHPQGGGQPSDIGVLQSDNGVSARVLQVKDVNGVILHWLDAPIAAGPVSLQVDPAVRHQHAMLHSVGHVIGNIGQRHGWKPVKAHHWPGECRIEFMPEASNRDLTADEIEDALATLIQAQLAAQIHVDDKGLRWVGFGELAPWPCGGTHLASLAEVGGQVSAAVKLKKNKLVVKYDIESKE